MTKTTDQHSTIDTTTVLTDHAHQSVAHTTQIDIRTNTTAEALPNTGDTNTTGVTTPLPDKEISTETTLTITEETEDHHIQNPSMNSTYHHGLTT